MKKLIFLFFALFTLRFSSILCQAPSQCIRPQVPCMYPPCQDRSCAPGNPPAGPPVAIRGRCYCPFGNLRNSANVCVPVATCDTTSSIISNLVSSIPQPYQPIPPTYQPYQPVVPSYQPYQPYQPAVNPFVPPPGTIQQPFYPNQAVIQPPPQIQTIQQPFIQPNQAQLNNSIANVGITNQVVPAPIFTTILSDLGPDPILYQLYNPATRDHLYTKSKDEIQRSVKDFGYQIEKELGRLPTNATYLPISCPLLRPLQRWFQPLVADHYYTVKDNDTSQLESNGYQREGNVGECVNGVACGATLPLHQFYNNEYKDHYYTTYQIDFQRVVNGTPPGFAYEGIVCYIWE